MSYTMEVKKQFLLLFATFFLLASQLSAVDAYVRPTTPLPNPAIEKFVGTWEEIGTANYSEYLEAIGAGWFSK